MKAQFSSTQHPQQKVNTSDSTPNHTPDLETFHKTESQSASRTEFPPYHSPQEERIKRILDRLA